MRTTPVNFIDHKNPNHRTTSPWPNITWPKCTLDSKEVLLFSNNASEENTTPYTYRADGIAAINEIEMALGV